ncbi:TlpA family protein disulfide reductase [Sphingobacterium sp. MYb388]|uniref:TlpA family protein disulfide reductase n=1 Tax=Sphingobacterium sp. MYb388 TaxID=2745437 RepID=UPI0030B1E7A9
MNINIQYIVKFWDYLRKLFKPEREGVLLSRMGSELPEYSVAKKALENNIAHATSVDFISQYAFDEGSTNVRDNLGTGTGLIRKSFGSSSTAVRQVPEGQSKRSRTAPEQDSKECRTRVEAQSNNTRTGVKQKILGRVNPDFFLTNLTPTSNFLRLGFGSASGFHRLQCMKSRSTVEQNLSGSRKRGQDREKKVYQEKDGATTVQVCCSYGETYYKGKRRLKESPNKIRTNGFAFFMVFMKNVLAKMVLDVRSVYGLFTNALLKRYQKGTGNVLESYQRVTEDGSLAVLGLACARQVREFGCSCVAQAYVMRMLSTGKAWIVRKTVLVYALLTHYQRFIYASSILNPYTESALSKIRGFKRSNFFCQVSEWFCINNQSNRLKCFSNQMQGGVRDVVNEHLILKIAGGIQFSTLIKRLFSEVAKTTKLSFKGFVNSTPILKFTLLLFIFSGLQISPLRLNAQVFVKSNERSLYIGDQVPNEFYTAKHKMIDWKAQKTYERNFEEYRDKLIILDFWASWCSPCLGSLKHLDFIIPQLDSSKVVIIPVNYETVDKMQHTLDRFQWHHQSVYEDTELMTLFPHAGIPHMVWIKDGRVIAMPIATYNSVENITKTIDNGVPLMAQNLNVKTADYEKPLFQEGNAPAEILYQDKLLKLAGYTNEYAEQTTEITRSKDSIFITMVNQPLDEILYSVFEQNISNFLGQFDGALKFSITADKNSYFLQSKPSYSDAGDYDWDSKVLEWDRNNLYSMDYRVPATMTDNQIGEELRSRIKHFMLKQFGIDINIAYTVEKSYPLVKLKGTKEETLKLLSQSFPKRNDQSHYQYFPDPANGKKIFKILSLLLSKVKGSTQDYHNVQDRTGLPKDFNYSYEIPIELINAKEMTMEDVVKFADQFNLKIEYERQPLPYLLIKNVQF